MNKVGFWNLIKTSEFKFYEENMSALEDIVYELREYRFCKNMFKDNYLGLNHNPLSLFGIDVVKQI